MEHNHPLLRDDWSLPHAWCWTRCCCQHLFLCQEGSSNTEHKVATALDFGSRNIAKVAGGLTVEELESQQLQWTKLPEGTWSCQPSLVFLSPITIFTSAQGHQTLQQASPSSYFHNFQWPVGSQAGWIQQFLWPYPANRPCIWLPLSRWENETDPND